MNRIYSHHPEVEHFPVKASVLYDSRCDFYSLKTNISRFYFLSIYSYYQCNVYT